MPTAMPTVEAAREALIAIRDPLLEEKTQLARQLIRIEADLAPIESALEALDCDASKPAKQRGKSKSKSPRQEDVRKVMLQLVAANPGIDRSELEELTKDKLRNELGFDLKGFANRSKEVLSKNGFAVEASGGVYLAGHPVAESKKPLLKPASESVVDRTFAADGLR
ncbi:hypothetical protein Pla108_27070 [Botrimarina colliarenosi]|uniref:Uncharacterized protein n=1 Tax=Botrimarina colliarenosi TaxID=2528001 RepID=A0A5C6ACZ3_9BACT|nr:hypothetical protein [Botrimarina colliarenosi]TWT96931.1 hypothetical protein Pla108_27070 [Botrimarina colliarenosi]